MTDQRIMEILKQETEIPGIVEKQAFDTLDRITAEQSGRRTGKNRQRISWMHPVKAAAIAMVILAGVGTGVYAAGTYIGLFDFLADQGLTETAGIEDKVDRGTDGVNFSNNYITYTVREALCDENIIYAVVEAKPKEPDQYLLIPQDCTEEDSVACLGMETAAEGSIGQYAGSLGKELLHSSVGLFRNGELLSCTEDNKMMEDGTVYYCITGVNDGNQDQIDLTCVGTAYKKGMKTADRAEADCSLMNYSSSRKSSYMVSGDSLAADLGISLDEIEITETELGLYARFHYHGENEAAEEMLKNCRWELTDASGKELVSMPYYAGSGIEFFDMAEGTGCTMTAAYQCTDIQQGIFAELYHSETDTKYGPYEMTKK